MYIHKMIIQVPVHSVRLRGCVSLRDVKSGESYVVRERKKTRTVHDDKDGSL